MSLNFPLAQGVQLTEPWKLDQPAGHSVQLWVGTSSSPKAPTGHASKPSPLSRILDPSGTSMEADAPGAAMCPRGTGIHARRPVALAIVPLLHFTHSACPDFLLARPGMHGRHDAERFAGW